MYPLMHYQLRSLWKERAASQASVSFDGLMGPHVLGKVSLEHLVANLAMKCFDVLVIAWDVLLQCVTTVKCFRADMAHEVTLVQMTFQVNLQIRLDEKINEFQRFLCYSQCCSTHQAGELWSTKIAFIFFDPSMSDHVLAQLPTARELFAANMTRAARFKVLIDFLLN